MTAPPSVVARPFLPAKDFAASKAFYEALGFHKTLDSQIAVFSCGGAGGFVLQDHYAEEWARNCMMQLMVDDLDVWWTHIAGLDLVKRFGVAPPKPPQMQPRGLKVAYVYDPAGVLWHVAQVRPDAPQDQP